MEASDQPAITAHLKKLYAEYRHTAELEAKARFFSPDCHQICRPRPAFAARDRDTIMRYLREIAGKGADEIQQVVQDADKTPPAIAPAQESADGASSQKKSFYTIRPLTDGEIEFGNDESAMPAGFDSADGIRALAERERWVGMRVDLWDDEGADLEGKAKGILVKVQYWWREEAGVWLQILHDIMYLGLRDGTEGGQGQVLE